MAPRTLARSRLRTTAGWARPAWYRGGVFSPVFYADGGDSEPAGDDGPDADTDPDVTPVDDWTPPTREEWETSQTKLRTATGEAAARRKYLREHGIDPKTGAKLNPNPDPVDEPAAAKDDAPRGLSQAEVQRAVDKAVTETQLKGSRQMRTFAVGFNKALSDAGWNGTRVDSLMKLLDLDDVDIDDGEITGLTEQIDGLKQDWPEFFKRQRSTPANPSAGSGQNGAPAAKVDTVDKKPPAAEPKGWAEQVAARVLRGQ